MFEKNRGYGAAIKEAWRRSDADLLGFLDADGTCDPKFFAPYLLPWLADTPTLFRLPPEHASQMPLIRRIGNMIFATILTSFLRRGSEIPPAECA